MRFDKPAYATWPPRKQFIRQVFARWTKEERHHLLWELFIETPAAQSQLFDFLMTTSDAAAWEAGQDYLIGTMDKDLPRRMAEAFDRETNPSRRAMLAYALAGNAHHPSVHASLFQALETQDEALLKRVLTRLSVGSFENFPDARVRVDARLRSVVGSGAGEELRVAAIRSLRGGESDPSIRFLLDLALRDPSPSIQRAALNSLPLSYKSHAPLLKEQFEALWIIIRDSSRDARTRRAAAEYVHRDSRGTLSGPDEALIKELLEKKD